MSKFELVDINSVERNRLIDLGVDPRGMKALQATENWDYPDGIHTIVSGTRGGLVGYATNQTTISNSYSTGSVTGSRSWVGGLVGFTNNRTTIIDSYATGSVTGSGDDVGGLVGSGDAITINIENSYWDINTTGQTSSHEGGIGLTIDEMMKQTNYKDWNFDEVWKIDEGNDYPTLR